MNFKTACLASMAAVSSAVILSGCSANSVLETPIKSEGFKLDTIVSAPMTMWTVRLLIML